MAPMAGRLVLAGVAGLSAGFVGNAGGFITLSGVASASQIVAYAYDASGSLFLTGLASVSASASFIYQASGSLFFTGLAGRLARARAMLAKRLTRQGVALSSGSLATVLSQQVSSASVPGTLMSATIHAAGLFASGSDQLSPQVLTLTQGVLKAMAITRIKIVMSVVLAIGMLGTGAGWLTHHALADKPGDKPVQKPSEKPAKTPAAPQDQTQVSGVVKAVDASNKTIVLHHGKAVRETTFTLDGGEVTVFLDDGTGDKLGFQPGKFTDVTEGSSITLRLTAERKVSRIWVEGPTVHGTLKSADADNSRITVALAAAKGEPAEEKTFTVAKDARLFIEDGQPRDKSQPAKPATLKDFPANAPVILKLSADRKVVGNIRAESPSATGIVKTVDADKRSLTVTLATKGEAEMERTYAVAKDAPVSIDEGKRKDKTKPAEAHKLADVPVGARVRLRLTFDQATVTAISVAAPTAQGGVKAVDAGKNTVTLQDKVDGEKTYTVANDAVVYFEDQKEGKKLADLPVDSTVVLLLQTDRQTVREIRVHAPTFAGTLSGNAGKDITIHNKAGDHTFPLSKDVRIVVEGNSPGKLEDLIDGAVVQVRLSADRANVLEVRAEGPSHRGIVKAVDADKITLTIGGKSGVGGEDKEFKLTKQTVVATEMKRVPVELKNLKVDTAVTLRLSLDQKAVVQILVLGE
jgi:Cu/Ag efflux protein CusF